MLASLDLQKTAVFIDAGKLSKAGVKAIRDFTSSETLHMHAVDFLSTSNATEGGVHWSTNHWRRAGLSQFDHICKRYVGDHLSLAVQQVVQRSIAEAFQFTVPPKMQTARKKFKDYKHITGKAVFQKALPNSIKSQVDSTLHQMTHFHAWQSQASLRWDPHKHQRQPIPQQDSRPRLMDLVQSGDEMSDA